MDWQTPPDRIDLPENHVHVWNAELNHPLSIIGYFRAILSEDERARADRFYFDRDRNRYISARGTLRYIIGEYLSTAPDRIRFQYSEHGKPRVSFPSDSVSFNLSHSHQRALYGFIKKGRIGIDVEYVRSNMDEMGIARRFFSASEADDLLKLTGNERLLGFFRCWTRKEAYIKALGHGLTHPLGKFGVSLLPDQPTALLFSDMDPAEPKRWRMCDLSPGQGYVAALAIEKRGAPLELFKWAYSKARRQD
ncbi:MAG: hypothetical protein B6244_09755 [Candidatus Cloacimonetes bacterium 4572_55]|nr:MAG: hypothetical protein B6244_09755 [Candidatus Cloacimonetes bacterium 4572_55]